MEAFAGAVAHSGIGPQLGSPFTMRLTMSIDPVLVVSILTLIGVCILLYRTRNLRHSDGGDMG